MERERGSESYLILLAAEARKCSCIRLQCCDEKEKHKSEITGSREKRKINFSFAHVIEDGNSVVQTKGENCPHEDIQTMEA